MLGRNPMRRARSMALLTHTLEKMSWDALLEACQSCPELQSFIRPHVYNRLQASPERMAYLDTVALEHIIEQQIRIQKQLPVARCLFPES